MSARRIITTTLTALLFVATPAFAASADEQLLERMRIQELQSKYALAHDITDPEMYASVFTEDAELYGAGGRLLAKGRQAFHDIGVNDRKRFNAGAPDGVRTFGALRHVITNPIIELTGDTTARGFCYVTTIVVRPGGGPEILSVSRYEDEYRKVNGEWLISRREIIGDMGNPELGAATGLF